VRFSLGRQQNVREALIVHAIWLERVIRQIESGVSRLALSDEFSFTVEDRSQHSGTDNARAALCHHVIAEPGLDRIFRDGLEPAAAATVLCLQSPNRSIRMQRVVLLEELPHRVGGRIGDCCRQTGGDDEDEKGDGEAGTGVTPGALVHALSAVHLRCRWSLSKVRLTRHCALG